MLKHFEPMDINYVVVNDSDLKDFSNKKFMKEFLESNTFVNDNGELNVPEFSEMHLSVPIYGESAQRRVLPFGFRTIDSEAEYTPLGRLIFTIKAFVTDKMPRDGRNPNSLTICEHKLHFVYNFKTERWLLVDFENENHQNTISYREREKEELELNSYYTRMYHSYYDVYSVMVNSSYSTQTVSAVRTYIANFKAYFERFADGMEAYRFFDSINPIEYKYIKLYALRLNELLNNVKGNLDNLDFEDMDDMTDRDKSLFNEVTDVTQKIREFFQGRDEKSLSPDSKKGYCPTFAYMKKLPMVAVPNAAEIERRAAFNSPNFHWSEEKEKEFLRKFVDYHFNNREKKALVAEPSVQYFDGVLGTVYGVTVEQIENWRKKPYSDAQKEFIKHAKTVETEGKNAYVSYLKYLKQALKGY